MTDLTLEGKVDQEEQEVEAVKTEEEFTPEIPEDLTLESGYVDLMKQIRSLAGAVNDINKKMYHDFNQVLSVRDQKVALIEQETSKGVMALSNAITALGAGFKVVQDSLVKLGIDKTEFEQAVMAESQKLNEEQEKLAAEMAKQYEQMAEEATKAQEA